MTKQELTRLSCKGRISLLRVYTILSFLIWVFVIPCSDQLAAEPQNQLLVALNQARQAIGYDALRRLENGLCVEGAGEFLGLPSTFRMFLFPDGAYCREIISELPMKEGFDGHTGWLVDETGMPGYLELAPLEQSQLIAWVMGGYWLDPECPLIKEMMPSPGQENQILISLRHPEGIVEATLTIDPGSFLPQRCQWTTFGQANFIELKKYEDVGEFLFPREFVLSVEAEQTELRIYTVYPMTEESKPLCRPVMERSRDTRFQSGERASVELKRIPSGNLAVHPLVNGQDVGWFLLDTGAGRSALDKTLADNLGMEAIGELPAMGIGGMVTVHYRRGEQLTLGPAEITKPTFIEIDLSSLAGAFGCDIGGILGYDLFMRCLVELDAQADSLWLFEPGTWNDRDADWQEIIFDRNAPALFCSFVGDQTGLFLVDTGFPGTLTFTKSFAEKHRLLEEQEVKTGLAGGVGGTLKTLSGQIEWFEIGGHRREDISISVAGESQGVLADEAIAGLMGTGLLSSFRMLIDYPNKRIAFLPRE